MKGVSYVLLPPQDRGAQKIKNIVLARIIRARRSIVARLAARASRANDNDRGL